MIRGHTIALYSSGKCDGVATIAFNSTNKCDLAPSSNLHDIHLPQKSPTVKYFQGSCDILHGVLNLKSISTPESTLVQDHGKELKLKVLETPVQLKR